MKRNREVNMYMLGYNLSNYNNASAIECFLVDSFIRKIKIASKNMKSLYLAMNVLQTSLIEYRISIRKDQASRR